MPAPPLVRETHIAAPPATVFAFLTDPEKILSWMGAEATTAAHAGGLYLIKGVGGQPDRVARGTFREVVPVHRLAYSFGWEGSEAVSGMAAPCCASPIAAFPTPSRSPSMEKVGSAFLADWRWRPPAEIPTRPRAWPPRDA